MEPRNFKRNAPGEVVEGFENGVTFYAFVPASLPPKLKMTSTLWNRLSEADRVLGELAGLSRTITNPQLLMRPFIRREAVLSSRIEGTRTDIAGLYAYEAGQLPFIGLETPATRQDAREVFNYVLALEYGLERLKSAPLSLHLLREVHSHLMEGVRGEHAAPGQFRTLQNYISSGHNTIAEARFVPPPVMTVVPLLRDLENYMKKEQDDLPPLIRLALIHYQFECIHPFADGNGRIGRLLITLLLVHWNILPLPLLYLSAYFEKHRNKYNDLLLAVSQRAAWEEWLFFFLQGVAEQAYDAIKRAKQLQDLRNEWLNLLHQTGYTGLLAGVTDYLFLRPVVAASDITRDFGVHHSTAMRTLRRLAEMDILRETTGQLRNQQFVALPILHLLD